MYNCFVIHFSVYQRGLPSVMTDRQVTHTYVCVVCVCVSRLHFVGRCR